MKLALFMIAFVAISFGAQAQSAASTTFRFHHVINGKKFASYKQKKLEEKDLKKYNRCIKRKTVLECTECLKDRSTTKGVVLVYVPQLNTQNQFTWGTLTCEPSSIATLPSLTSLPVKYDETLNITTTNQVSKFNKILMPKQYLKCNLTTGVSGVDGVVVDFWRLNNNLGLGYINNSIPIATPSKFILPLYQRRTLSDPSYYAKIGFRSLALGIGVNTFRYRPKQDSTLATTSVGTLLNFNFGYAFGFSKITTKRMTNYSLLISGFVGFSTVDLKSSTVKTPTIWKNTLQTDRVNPAVSYGLSTILSRNNLGIVFSLGWDCNIGPNARQWAYQNKPWFGIGVNASLGMF